ncbi:MAG: aliphatic sulfonates ABC transporter substrate-binding protein, partial [Micrococcaceae bacterium]|nr:aliphatic sulfonates ABC transporter substrate-binding protein [Micrococcaceae bacterium]
MNLNNTKRRDFLAGGLGLATIAALTACAGSESSGSSGGAEKMPIKVGYIADYNGAALLALANEEGYWDQAGLKPDFVP